jgi:menaquinone-dependent protoporphyrinogen IX oxidase
VLIGSAVQYGTWLPEAVDFVKTQQATLARLAVALFCVHIQNGGDDENSRQKRHAYLDAVRPLVQPVAEGFFMGRFNRRGARLMLPGWLARFVPTLDFRNWDRVHAWGETVFEGA